MANPFAALVESGVANKTVDFASQSKPNTTYVTENIFGFTLNKSKQGEFLYLQDLADTFSTEEFNFEILEQALFERLLLTTSNFNSVNIQDVDEEDKKVISYLFRCFTKNEQNDYMNLKVQVKQLIIRNVITAIKQPGLYEGQDLIAQMYDVLKSSLSEAHDFFIQTFDTFQNEEDGEESKEPLKILLKLLHVEIASASLVMFPCYIFKILNIYATHKWFAKIMLEYTQPKQPNVGTEYYNTLLGALLCVSALPKTIVGEYEFFQEGLNPVNVSRQEGILWSASDVWNRDIHNFILNLLKCDPEIRSQTLTWIGSCLKANADRGKLWNAHAPHLNIPNTVSDGFMLNLGILLLKLCRPFCSNIKDGKILRLDPTFCAVPNEACREKGIHLLDMSKETCLVPVSESTESRCNADTYGFVTECFFMAHRAFEIGFRVLSDKLLQYNQEVARIERAYQDTMAGNMGVDDVLETIKQRLETELAKYLSTKCVMSEPNFLSESFSFFSATAYWLNNVAMNVQQPTTSATFAPLKEHPIIFPLSENIPDTLKCIPEFVIENIVCYLIFLKRFNRRTFEEQGYDHLNPILTFILVYMGSSGYVRNPHLRAHLAEALEALLPSHKDEPSDVNSINSAQRERLFKDHEHRKEIVAVLMDVFVSIEMTGQNVQFEQKFNYRRPMYLVIHYLWEMNEYELYFSKLAEEAEFNMEAVPPPIFLRFVNLLINDAIFLLDESLTNMAKLRELETKQENGEWNNLSIQERAQNFGYLRHTAMMAKFDNILGRDTIKTLGYLTSAITIVFTHRTMVDRVAAMLNYFLLKLVGPDKKNFKVKDQKEYSFNPAATVLDICKIYVNLKESDSFCLAVSQDGRSYSPKLFTLAEVVLVKIGGGQLVGELQDVAKKVADKAAEYKSNEEAAADAPDNYLDPIMSTLMLDPVILPSSKQIVDRSTIARHLLSDQTDPFNRAPLSMDQVIPNTELAAEIRKWLEEKKKQG